VFKENHREKRAIHKMEQELHRWEQMENFEETKEQRE
jgi:hypothetical protein